MSKIPFFLISTPLFLVLTGCGVAGTKVETTVTQRDITTAQNMNAPTEVIDSLSDGKWSVDGYSSVRQRVRLAEDAENHMHDRYGVEFSATDVGLSSGFLSDGDIVRLQVMEGPAKGRQVTVTVDDTSDRTYDDDYVTVLTQDASDKYISSIARTVFSELDASDIIIFPYACFYVDEVPDAIKGTSPSLTDETIRSLMSGDCICSVTVYLSPDVTYNEETFDQACHALDESIKNEGIDLDWSVTHITVPLDGKDFDMAFIKTLSGSDTYDYRRTSTN